jgi:hypothetical protein
MCDDSENVEEEMIMGCCNVVSRQSLEETEKEHEEFQSR